MPSLLESIFEETGIAKDTYLQSGSLKNKLISDYKRYGQIIIAYDFDDTVYSDDLSTTEQVRELLREVSKYNEFVMIVYTARTPDMYQEVRDFLERENIRYDKINKQSESSNFPDKGQKIFYNIFLDDRAGLRAAYEELANFFYWFLQVKGVK